MRHHNEPQIKGVEIWFVVLLWALLFGPPCHGQDFDRLTIRPYFETSAFNYKSGILTWAQSDGWPTADPETIGLRAPESGVSRYTMTFGEVLPDAKACIKVDETGQWYYENCGGGSIELLISEVILPDQSSGNDACSLGRDVVAVSGVDVFYLVLDCGVGEHAQWLFRVPPAFTTTPRLLAWSDRSGTGEDDYIVKLRCTQPNNSEVFTSIDWDATYTSAHDQTVSGDLSLIDISLAGADMEADDICIVDLEADEEQTNIYYVSVR